VSSPARPGGGLQRGGAHTRNGAEFLFEGDHDLEPTLAQRSRRAGMHAIETGIARNSVTELRVVLHGARAKRVHSEIDRKLTMRKTSEVSDEISFGDFRDGHHVIVEMSGGHEVTERGVRKSGGAQLIGRTTRRGHLKERGLGFVTHDRRGRRPTTWL